MLSRCLILSFIINIISPCTPDIAILIDIPFESTTLSNLCVKCKKHKKIHEFGAISKDINSD